MKWVNKNTILLYCMIMLVSCRKDIVPIKSQQEILFSPNPGAAVKGMYLLNEGGVNSNKASLDYVDFTTGIYSRNIYGERNPEVTKGLGDVGNDIGIYGSKLYIVVNNSNKVEVIDAKTCKRIQQIDIVNCRYICFAAGKAFVSAYLGTIGDPHATNGIVAEIDTTSLTITRRVTVGRQPEELTAVGDHLFVANSGGYSPPDYERTISVIDIASFVETNRIDVALNLNRLKADRAGNIYVTARGDYFTTSSSVFKINVSTQSVARDYHLSADNICIEGDTMFTLSNAWNYNEGKNSISYGMINIKSDNVLGEPFIKDGTEKMIEMPYGLVVNPESKDIFITDAKDFVSPGTLYCFDKSGQKKWSVTTGDIPGHFAFVH